MTELIALLVDSGVNLPAEIISLKGVYEVPLTIVYGEKAYEDGVDITPSDIYQHLDTALPTTSLPSGQAIYDTLVKVTADGYNKLLVMTVSSQLSGTYHAIKLATEDFPNLTTVCIDTKNAAMGSGLQAAYGKELIDKNMPFADIVTTLTETVTNTAIYITLPTLVYLKRGGRISALSSFIGSSLNIHPILSCDADGLISSPAKARGRKSSIQKLLQLGDQFLKEAYSYDLAVVYTNCPDDALQLAETIKQRFPNYRKCHISQASPVVGIHTGPDAIGFAMMVLPNKKELT